MYPFYIIRLLYVLRKTLLLILYYVKFALRIDFKCLYYGSCNFPPFKSQPFTYYARQVMKLGSQMET